MTTVRDLMTEDIDLIPGDATVRAAADCMRRLGTGLLFVVEGGRYLGTLTDRDIAVKMAADGRDANVTTVRDIMTPEIDSLFEDQDAGDAAVLMSRLLVLRFPVLDRHRRPIGVVALGDVAVAAGSRPPAPAPQQPSTFVTDTEDRLATGIA